MAKKLVLFCFYMTAQICFAQTNMLTIIEGSDTTNHDVIYRSLDSLEQKKLIGYFKELTSQKAIEKQYFLGKQSGKEYTFFPTGKVYEISIFQNGMRNGDYSRFNSLGELVVKARYAEGRLNGFYINREANYQGKYRKGLKSGKWEFNVGTPNYYKEFYKDGELAEKRQILSSGINLFNKEKSNIVVEPKNPIEDSIFVPYKGDSTCFKLRYVNQDSLKHPAMRKAYYISFPHQVALTKYVYNGYVNGMYKMYYPNGNLNLFANYTAGLLDGKWKAYDEKGELHTKGKYLDGKKIGVWLVNIGSERERKEIYRNGILKKTKNSSK